MRYFENKDITEHIYHDGTVNSARCALWGVFPEEETEKSGLKSFNFVFSPYPETDEGQWLSKFEDYDILDFDINKTDGRYEVTLNCESQINGETDFKHIHFYCENISCCLCTFENFSYTNIYSSGVHPEGREFYDEKYFICTDNYDLSDGFRVQYDVYGEESGIGNKYTGARIAKCTYYKDDMQIFEHFTDSHHLHPFRSLIHHSNGNTYIPYHTDLYGISFFEVETGRNYDYIPEGMEHDISFSGGESFIVCDIFYDKDSDLLACDGCYWACPNEIFIMDFSCPLHFDPRMVRMHGEVPMDYNEYDDIGFVRWEKESLVLKGEDGKEYAVTKARIKEMLAEKRVLFPLDGFDK